MDSKKKIRLSYRWRLFIPSVLLVWLVIAVLTKYQYSYERDYRTKIIRNELALIDQRILQNYERGYDVGDFVKFLGQGTARLGLSGRLAHGRHRRTAFP